MIGYKLLIKIVYEGVTHWFSYNGEYYTAFSTIKHGTTYDWCVEYKPNEWTVPHKDCGPLAVFTDEHSATYHTNSEIYLWKCDYEPSTEAILYVNDDNIYNTMSLAEILHSFKSTVFATKVKILEQI